MTLLAEPSRHELLSAYLNDHLMGATGGVELFRRAAGTQSSDSARARLAVLADDVTADREALRAIMRQLGVKPKPAQVATGWLGEKLGRLKPNGSLLRRTALTDLVELEAMTLAVEGKAACWKTLILLADTDDRLDREAVQELDRRAGAQLDELESLRRAASQQALTATA